MSARRAEDLNPADGVDVYELTADDWEIPEEWKPAPVPPRDALGAALPNSRMPFSIPLGLPPSPAATPQRKTDIRHKA